MLTNVRKRIQNKKKKKLPKKQSDVIYEKLKNNGITRREISEKLGLNRYSVDKYLSDPRTKEILAEAESKMIDELTTIKVRALGTLSDMVSGFYYVVDNDGNKVKKFLPPGCVLGAVKFVLASFVEQEKELRPDSITFETVINESGGVDQKVTKQYKSKAEID